MNMKDSDERIWVKLAKQGDAVAFESLVQKHYLFVYKVAFKYCRQKEDAEDITQDVFLKLAKKILSYKENASFQTWLYRVTINAAKDFVRKKQRHRNREADYHEDEASKQNIEMKTSSAGEAILAFIEKLPAKQKETAVLVFSEGLNHKEVARILECAETTISWRVYQIRKKITKYLKKGGLVL